MRNPSWRIEGSEKHFGPYAVTVRPSRNERAGISSPINWNFVSAPLALRNGAAPSTKQIWRLDKPKLGQWKPNADGPRFRQRIGQTPGQGNCDDDKFRLTISGERRKKVACQLRPN